MSADLVLPFLPESAGVARRRLGDWMSDRGAAPEAVADAQLVVTELVGNSVRHADPLDDDTVAVGWHVVDGDPGLGDQLAVHLSVTDGGALTAATTQHPDDLDLSGRGLGIVGHLTRQWWVQRARARTTVHALLG